MDTSLLQLANEKYGLISSLPESVIPYKITGSIGTPFAKGICERDYYDEKEKKVKKESKEVEISVYKFDQTLTKFPELGEKRKVEISVSSFKESQKGAKHYYVRVVTYDVTMSSHTTGINARFYVPVTDEILLEHDGQYVEGEYVERLDSLDTVFDVLKDFIENHLEESTVYVEFLDMPDIILSQEDVERFYGMISSKISIIYRDTIYNTKSSK